MSKIKDGGPAFPHPRPDYSQDRRDFGGMSLRDWFASQALVGICAGLCSDSVSGDPSRAVPIAAHRLAFSDAAKDAYHIADAMIAAREGEQP